MDISVTRRRGLVTLVPKKNKPVNLLKNWRPVFLLNCDYEVATKSIANRIKKVLPKISNNDQTAFLQNRTIVENIRIIDSIIKYANTKQIPGLLLFIDFQKAFNNIKWPFTERTLKHFNFGASLVTCGLNCWHKYKQLYPKQWLVFWVFFFFESRSEVGAPARPLSLYSLRYLEKCR